ncbi:MAG: alpha/beta hydrolase [Isosphaeraceae bacterium]
MRRALVPDISELPGRAVAFEIPAGWAAAVQRRPDSSATASWSWFMPPDRTELNPAESFAAVPRRPVSCVVLHGLGGGPYELKPLIEALENEGLRTTTPVLPGHEGPRPRMPVSTWKDWTAAAENAFHELAALGHPVAVIGFSTGATIGLNMAARLPVARLVLLAPFLAIRYTALVPFRPAMLLRPLARIVPDLPRRPPAVRDSEMRRRAAEAERFRTFNLHAAISALELIEQVKSLVPSITTPTLILQGQLDTVVEPASAKWLYQNLGSTEKELVSLPNSDHLLALDRERDQVVSATLEFLLRRGPTATSSLPPRPA